MKTIDRLKDTAELERRQQIEQARKDIKNAFQAGLVMVGINSLVFLVVLFNPSAAAKVGADGWLIIDLVIICGCTYGIYRNSPLAAKIMLGYYLINILVKIGEGSFKAVGIPLTALFCYYFFKGVTATTALKQLTETQEIFDESLATSKNEYPVAATPASVQVKKPSVQFWIDDRLIELCGGDRSQAEWLLHQIVRKNPDRTMEWCNAAAIEQVDKSA